MGVDLTLVHVTCPHTRRLTLCHFLKIQLCLLPMSDTEPLLFSNDLILLMYREYTLMIERSRLPMRSNRETVTDVTKKQ